jgi:hypothetical protein
VARRGGVARRRRPAPNKSLTFVLNA